MSASHPNRKKYQMFAKGAKVMVCEGNEDDIRSFHYLWALQPNEQADSEHKWQLTELAIRGVMSTY